MRGRLKGNQLYNLNNLLDMLYTAKELAQEIGFTRRQIYRVYIPMGCPHQYDATGHIWIHGIAFRDWYRKTYKKRKLASDEIYCISCKKVVPLRRPEKRQSGAYIYWSVICPNCGKRTSKAISNRRCHD